jgi:hypothetical protein
LGRNVRGQNAMGRKVIGTNWMGWKVTGRSVWVPGKFRVLI